jgi:penicillin amidase
MQRLILAPLLTLVVIGLGIAFALWITVRLSLPQLDGGQSLAGLMDRVEVTRDALGVPTLTAQSRSDLALATGFIHAQERFFQMDLLRRLAAGELSALIGAPAIAVDRANRRHRFRAAAEVRLPQLDARHRALLEAYAQGVNAGLDTLKALPFEYLVLRATPEPWRAEDTLLVNFAMYLAVTPRSASASCGPTRARSFDR